MMKAFRRQVACVGSILLLGLAGSAWAQSTTQPAAKEGQAGPKVGYVRGNNVYVRSGFHQNYYPVTKLNRGDKVTILGEEFGWLKIVPPAGTHSLVDKSYVDRVDDQAGVINGATTVYAGSNLNDRRYAKQVQLTKGGKVRIIGETTDGAFYKIQPPAGAELWIKGDLVDQTGRLEGLAGGPSTDDLEVVQPGQLGDVTPVAPKTTAPTSRPASKTARSERPIDQNKYQMDINAIEAEIAAENTKPTSDRSFEPIIAKLHPMAEQTEDETAHLYAQTRIKQLRGHMELVAAVRELRELKETTIDEADKIAAARSRIKAEAAVPLDDIIVRGQIRVSGLYDGTSTRPRRWRVVDLDGGRTLAYIEVPQGSPIDPVQYYGKYVGIRASERRMLRGTIPPVPIYTVKEITVLDPANRGKEEPKPAKTAETTETAETETATSQPAGE